MCACEREGRRGRKRFGNFRPSCERGPRTITKAGIAGNTTIIIECVRTFFFLLCFSFPFPFHTTQDITVGYVAVSISFLLKITRDLFISGRTRGHVGRTDFVRLFFQVRVRPRRRVFFSPRRFAAHIIIFAFNSTKTDWPEWSFRFCFRVDVV